MATTSSLSGGLAPAPGTQQGPQGKRSSVYHLLHIHREQLSRQQKHTLRRHLSEKDELAKNKTQLQVPAWRLVPERAAEPSRPELSCTVLVQGGKSLPCLSPRSSALKDLLHYQQEHVHNHIPPPPCVSEDRVPKDSRGKGMKSSPWYMQMANGKAQSQGSGSCTTTHQALTREGN